MESPWDCIYFCVEEEYNEDDWWWIYYCDNDNVACKLTGYDTNVECEFAKIKN